MDEPLTDKPGPLPQATLPAGEPRRRQGAILAALAALNLVGGFLMQWYILGTLGAGLETDALFAGLALPQALLTIIASSFMHVLVPLLSGEDQVRFRRDAWTFAAITLGTFLALAAALAWLAPWWVPVLAPGLQGTARTLTIHLARIQLIGMVCTSMAGVLWAVHRARHHFIWAECAPLVATIAAWVVLVAALPRYGIHAAAWVQVLRIGLHAVLLAPGLGGFTGFTRDRRTLAEAWRRLRPLMLGTAYFRTEPLVDRGLSSLAPAGDLSLYYLCQQVATAALQLANNALIAPLVPVLARQAKAGDWTAFHRARRRVARTVFWLACGGFLALLGLGTALVATDLLPAAADVLISRAGWLLLGLGGVLIAGPIAECLRTAFYAAGNTATPVRLDALVYTAGLVLKVGGFAAFGVLGLALAASVQAVLGVLALRRGVAGVERPSALSRSEG